ncbi:membrane protein insertion efficiency factor YidD [Candidatus Gottesmanbacteria bacterium]|nr:membrane protein insertion efficiency factor YidD [Candidatus Gottesmanbacteria bacterium]
MKSIFLIIIKTYQKYISESVIGRYFLNDHCRFSPTCSQYTYEAIGKYGTIKGLFLGFNRILRCHPFSNGGVDPVK